MTRKIRFLYILLFCFTFTITLSAQNFTRHNWLFSDNDQSLLFGKELGSDPILNTGKIAQSNSGEKITVSDPTTGDLLFYSDGTNIYDASHSIMVRGDGINANTAGFQSMAVSPVPAISNDSLYYVFTRSTTGELFYTTVDMNAEGNRVDGPNLGEVQLGERNQPTGITNRADGLITIGSQDMSRFWLITQNATSGAFEVFSINDGGIFTQESVLVINATIETMHFAYSNRSSRIAIIPSNNVNIQVLLFNETTQTLEFELAIANSFVPNETFGGSAGWSFFGTKLFFSRNGAADGNVFRYDMNNLMATVVPILPVAVPESLSLMIAPDSSIYHLYRATAGGERILGRINNAELDIASLEYESDVMTGQDFSSDYFQQFLPEKRIAPTVEFVFQEPCLNNPTLFLPIITPPEAEPSRYTWDFQGGGQTSNQRSPIVTFEQAGMINIGLTVEINGVNYSAPSQMLTLEENDLEVQLQDTTICPGEVLELDAEPEGQGGGGGIGVGTGTYTYRWSTGETSSAINVTEAGDYWVVVTPQPVGSGCAVYSSAEVTVYGDENPTSNIWYFGNGAGIDFNEVDGLDPPPRSITDAHAMNAPEGTSTISDANGDVLFYTDGDTVYNNLNQVMENGAAIGGDVLSTQSVIIVPFLDDETLYYLFTTQEIYGTNEYRLKYSVVDMKGGDGLGAVTVKDQILFTKSTEKIAAFEAGGGYWILSHEYGTNTFRAYAVSAAGISPPVLSSLGSVHSLNDALSGQAGMKFSGGGDRVAVALIDGTDDYIEFFQFEVTTGELTELDYVIDLNEDGAANDEVYDVHFSPGGNKIFATMNQRNTGGPGGRILEYRIDTFSTAITRQESKTNIADGNGSVVNFGGIQTGPDGQIYVAVEVPGNPSASAFVSMISSSEDTASVSSFNLQQIMLATGNSRLGLPNFVQNSVNPQDEPAMSAPDSTCVDELVAFSATGTSDIDQYYWTINDPSNNLIFSALAQDTSYTFVAGQSGSFELSLNIFNRCGFDTTFVQDIVVFDIPDPPTIPAAITFCEGDPNPLTAGPDDPILSYVWTNSQGTVVSTSNTFDVTEQEIYTVTITNILGCSSTGQVFAGPPFEITLPPDITICQDEPLTLDPNVAANNYIWTVINPDNSTVTLPNQRVAEVDSSLPGIFQYIVSIEDPIEPGCFVNDTTNVTINPIPLAVPISTTPATCGANTGAIELSVTTTGNYSYQLLDNSGAVVQTESNFTGPGPVNLTGLPAGVYSVIFTDNSSSCTNSLTGIEVTDSNSDINIDSFVTVDAACGSSTGSVTVTLNTAAVFPITYTLTNTSDPSVPPISGSAATPLNTADFEVTSIPGGSYDLEVTSAGGCIATETGIVVNVPVDVGLTVTNPADVCGSSVSLNTFVSSTTPGTTYAWIDAASLPVVDPTNVTASGIYTVTASAAGFCDVVANLEVNLSIQPIVVINRIDDVCDGSLTLEAEVTNPQAGVSYSYTWSTGEQTREITVSTDDTYDVIVRETGVLNCPSVLVAEVVAFPEPMQAIISSTPACDDGQPITISVQVLAGSPTGYSWTHNGNVIAGSGPSIIISDEGNYTVTISQGICSIERTLLVRRSNIPDGLLPDEDFYCPTANVNPRLTAGNGFDTYVWTLDGAPYNNNTAILEIQAAGLYEVTMTTTLGCVRVDSVNVIESCDPKIIVPNVFIPGGNPPNDVFFALPNDFVDNFEVFIYTRWGELIFQSNSTGFEWDGTYGGILVPTGTYAYIIRFTSRFEPGKGKFEQTGGVTVLR